MKADSPKALRYIDLLPLAIGIVAFGMAREYPAIGIQWWALYLVYWVVSKLLGKFYKFNPAKQAFIEKLTLALGILGLLGLISPLAGIAFALPGYVLAENNLGGGKKNKRLIFLGIVIFVCVIHANIAAVINSKTKQPTTEQTMTSSPEPTGRYDYLIP